VWLFESSLAEIAPRNRHARKPYKRFSPAADTFPATHFKADFGKTDFSTATPVNFNQAGA
jgi:hypothetical protein